MSSSGGAALRALAALTSFIVAIFCGQAAAADSQLTVSGGRLDPTYPMGDVYLETPRTPPVPSGAAACEVAQTYVELVNAGKYSEVAALYADDATFLEPVRPSLHGKEEIHEFYTTRIGPMRPELAAVAYLGNAEECMVELALKNEIDGRPRYVLVSIDHFIIDGDGKIKSMVAFVRPPSENARAFPR